MQRSIVTEIKYCALSWNLKLIIRTWKFRVDIIVSSNVFTADTSTSPTLGAQRIGLSKQDLVCSASLTNNKTRYLKKLTTQYCDLQRIYVISIPVSINTSVETNGRVASFSNKLGRRNITSSDTYQRTSRVLTLTCCVLY